jgi:DNA-directed RNA polymerase specialized sigma subunit
VNQFLKEDDRMKLVLKKLKMIQDVCREIIELFWKMDNQGKNLSWMEIAAILDMSYAYVRKKASECKSRLTELVRKDLHYKELI